jgi:hypothetical protein
MGISEGRKTKDMGIDQAKDIPNLVSGYRRSVRSCSSDSYCDVSRVPYEGNLFIPSYEFCCFSAFRTIPFPEIAFQYAETQLINWWYWPKPENRYGNDPRRFWLISLFAELTHTPP